MMNKIPIKNSKTNNRVDKVQNEENPQTLQR